MARAKSKASPKKPAGGKKLVVKKPQSSKTEHVRHESPDSRRLFGRTSDEATKRALNVKLHMYPQAQVENNVDEDGEQIFPVAKRELKRCQKINKHISLDFWQGIIKRHNLGGTVPDKMAEPTDPSPVRRDLDDAFKVLHDANPARRSSLKLLRLINCWIDTGEKLNRTEFYGLIKGSWEAPSLTRNQSRTVLEQVLKWIGRVRMDQIEGDYWACLSTHFDVQLATSLQRAQAGRVSRANFLRANRDALQLFLNLEVATRIEECVKAGKNKPDPKDVDMYTKI